MTLAGNDISGGQYGVWIGNEWSVAGVASGDVDIDVTFVDNFVHDNAADAVQVVDENRAAGSLTCFLAVPAGAGEQPGPDIAPPSPTGP